MQLLILGMHRSGTSLITRLVNLMGAYVGAEGVMLSAAADNPKGFWERGDVLNINENFLHRQKCLWNKLKNWDISAVPAPPPEALKQMRRIILNMDGFRPWVLKDPRLCLTLPAWKPLLEAPVAIIVYRDPVEIALSLQNRNKMPLEWSLAMWEYHAVSLLNASFDMPRVHVQHTHALSSPVALVEKLHEGLREIGVTGLRIPSPQEITAFIDPSLYRAKAENASAMELSDHRQQLVALLKGEVSQTRPVTLSEETRQVMAAQG